MAWLAASAVVLRTCSALGSRSCVHWAALRAASAACVAASPACARTWSMVGSCCCVQSAALRAASQAVVAAVAVVARTWSALGRRCWVQSAASTSTVRTWPAAPPARPMVWFQRLESSPGGAVASSRTTVSSASVSAGVSGPPASSMPRMKTPRSLAMAAWLQSGFRCRNSAPSAAIAARSLPPSRASTAATDCSTKARFKPQSSIRWSTRYWRSAASMAPSTAASRSDSGAIRSNSARPSVSSGVLRYLGISMTRSPLVELSRRYMP